MFNLIEINGNAPTKEVKNTFEGLGPIDVEEAVRQGLLQLRVDKESGEILPFTSRRSIKHKHTQTASCAQFEDGMVDYTENSMARVILDKVDLLEG